MTSFTSPHSASLIFLLPSLPSSILLSFNIYQGPIYVLGSGRIKINNTQTKHLPPLIQNTLKSKAPALRAENSFYSAASLEPSPPPLSGPQAIKGAQCLGASIDKTGTVVK